MITNQEQSELYKQVYEHFSGKGRVEALVLTTFGLDVRYLERFILPAFFPELGEGPATEPHRPLFEYLEENPIPISVLFDVENLVSKEEGQVATTSIVKELRWQAHPVRGSKGCFHSKLIIALLKQKSGERVIVLGCLSANLTRSGWGMNLEICALQTLPLWQGVQSSLLVDLFSLVGYFRTITKNAEALNKIWKAIKAAKPIAFGTRCYQDNYRPRLWHSSSQACLSKWLSQEVLKNDLGQEGGQWRLEVISPYYSEEVPQLIHWAGKKLNKQVSDISDTGIRRRDLLCYCPQTEGRYDISPELARVYEDTGHVTWASIPDSFLTSKLKDSSGGKLKRFLHAKVYRFWCPQNEILVVGSANATIQGHRDNGGNDEAVVVFNRAARAGKVFGPWLTPLNVVLNEENCSASPSDPEDQSTGRSLPNVAFSYDWARNVFSWDNQSAKSINVFVGGGHQTRIEIQPKTKDGINASSDVRSSLFRSPTVRISLSGNPDTRWLYLIQEAGLHAKPPAPTMERGADELICDWQHTFDERLTAHLAAAASDGLEGALVNEHGSPGEDYAETDRLNDVFLALHRFRQDVSRMLGDNGQPDAYYQSRIRSRVFGAGAMSVKYLSEKVENAAHSGLDEAPIFDSVDCYLTQLSIRDAVDSLTVPLQRAEFADELDELGLFLEEMVSQARKRVLDTLQKENSPYAPTQLLSWIEDHFSTAMRQNMAAS